MVTKMFAVYDSKAEAYMPPFCFSNKGQAIRAFTQAAQDENSNIGKFRADFALFEIGEFDDSSGVVKASKVPINLGLAQEFVAVKLPAREV